ncbi:hypothetical protein PENSPDRAFT_682119 [Peniophora sp. CONT]|nr:hypothetical protein PENSPDRAFT_682119 [Peniophora sp. CONT]
MRADAANKAAGDDLSDIQEAIRKENRKFFMQRTGFSRSQLHGHRVGEAYESIREFVLRNREDHAPDFEGRLCTYADVLFLEMRLYETTRTADSMEENGSYRLFRKPFKRAMKVPAVGRARALEKALQDGPEVFEVEEEAWPAALELGALIWWRLIERNVVLTLENILGYGDSDSDAPLAPVEIVVREDNVAPPADTKPNLRPRRGAAANSKRGVETLPTKPLRDHARGKGGVQPDAEHVTLREKSTTPDRGKPKEQQPSGEDAADRGGATDGEANDGKSSRDGEKSPKPSNKRGRRRSLRLNPAIDEDDDVPEDVVERFNKLHTGSRAYIYRPPHGLSAKIPANGLRTADDIRQAHTDADGNIISTADITELFATGAWYGLPPGGSPFDVACHNCVAKGLACHDWYRHACTNCYASRTKCEEGVGPRHRKKARPERRLHLLEQLEDVLGGWDSRLNEVGEAYSEIRKSKAHARQTDAEETQPTGDGPTQPDQTDTRETQTTGGDGIAVDSGDSPRPSMSPKPSRRSSSATNDATLEQREGQGSSLTAEGVDQPMEVDAIESTAGEASRSVPAPLDCSVATPSSAPARDPSPLCTTVSHTAMATSQPCLPSANSDVAQADEALLYDDTVPCAGSPSALSAMCDDDAPPPPPFDFSRMPRAMLPTHAKELSQRRAASITSARSARSAPEVGRQSRSSSPDSAIGRGARRVAKMEPAEPTARRTPRDRPRVVALPLRAPDDSLTSPRLTRAEFDDYCKRADALESTVHDHHAIASDRFAAIQVSLTNFNALLTTMLNLVQTTTEHARRGSESSSSALARQEDFMRYTRSVLDNIALHFFGPAVFPNMQQVNGPATPSRVPFMQATIHNAVEQTEAALNKLCQAKLDEQAADARREIDALKEKITAIEEAGRREIAAIQGEVAKAVRMTAAMEENTASAARSVADMQQEIIRLKEEVKQDIATYKEATSEKLDGQFAALTISHTISHSTRAGPLTFGDLNFSAAPKSSGVADAEALVDSAATPSLAPAATGSEPRHSREGSVPSSNFASAGAKVGLDEHTSEQAHASGTDATDEGDQSLPIQRKRRGSVVEGLDASRSEEPHKRRRSSSPVPEASDL